MSDDQPFEPDWASPPGDTIKDMLEERSMKDLARKLNLTPEQMDDLMKGALPLTEGIAINLVRNLGGSVQFWRNRESNYRSDLIRLAKKKDEDIKHCGSDLCRNPGTRNVYNQCSCNCQACRQTDQVEKRQQEYEEARRERLMGLTTDPCEACEQHICNPCALRDELEQYQLDCRCADFAVENDELRKLLRECLPWLGGSDQVIIDYRIDLDRRICEMLENKEK